MSDRKTGRCEARILGGKLRAPGEPGDSPPFDRELFVVLGNSWDRTNGSAASTARSLPPEDSVVLVDGRAHWSASAAVRQVIRLHLTNSTRSQTFNLRLPGARLKLVGNGLGRVETETFVDNVLLVPEDRVVIDVQFRRPGEHRLEHRRPGRSLSLLTFEIGQATGHSRAMESFQRLQVSREFLGIRRAWGELLAAEPAVTIATGEPLVRQERAATISPTLPKVRLLNDSSPLRPHQHLVRLEAGRCLALSRDGVAANNLLWTDTMLLRAGEVVDILPDPQALRTLVFRVRDIELPASGGAIVVAFRG